MPGRGTRLGLIVIKLDNYQRGKIGIEERRQYRKTVTVF